MKTRWSRWAALCLLPFVPGAARAEEAGTILLRLHLKEKESYPIWMLSDQKISQTIQGKALDIAQTMGMGYVNEVEKVEADGTAAVRVTYNRVLFKQSGPMGNIEYDSKKPPDDVPPAAKGFAALLGLSFSFRLDPAGRVQEVRGVGDMMDAMLKKLELPEGPQRDAVMKSLKSQFGDANMKQMLESGMATFPDKPVKVGDTWTKKAVIAVMVPMNVDTTYTLKAREGGMATIESSSTVKPNPDGSPMEIGNLKLRYELSGTQTASMTVQESSGMVVNGKIAQEMAGKVHILGQAEGAEGSSWPMTIKSLIKLESKE